MTMDDEFDFARGILTGCVLSLGMVFGCAVMWHLVATWVGA